jgi:malate/lactate dehydrogenase
MPEDALVAGQPARVRLGDRGIVRIDRGVATIWPPGPAALSAAGAAVAEAVVKGSRRVVPCFVVGDGTLWEAGRALAVPVRLGCSGVEEVRWPDLLPKDRTTLESSLSRRGGL